MDNSIRVEFDRPDRTYRAGEPVGGLLRIDARGGGRCKGIRLTHSWETRGLGNTDRGFPPRAIPHSRDDFAPNSVYVVPFEFPAPKGPLSYHGKALDVVHYMEVEADFQGIEDLWRAEEFVVVPGPLSGPPPKRQELPDLPWEEILLHGKAPPSRSRIGRSILSSFLKRQVAELKLGSVKTHLRSQVTLPGDPLDVEIRLTPKKPIKVNGASIELRAQEIWVSGTGRNRVSNRVRVYSKVTPIPIPTPNTLGPESLSTFKAATSIPDNGLFSFVLGENSLAWEAVVRVDIPFWPDWERVIPLLVWPSEGLEEAVQPGEGPEVEEEIPVEAEPETDIVPGVRAGPGLGAGTAPTLAEAVRAIRAEGIFHGSRNRLIQELLERQVTFDLLVGRVEQTFAMYSDPAYRHGRTVVGTIPDTDVDVSVSFPEVLNEVIDALEPGSVHPVRGTVAEIDRLSLRPKVRADDWPQPVGEPA